MCPHISAIIESAKVHINNGVTLRMIQQQHELGDHCLHNCWFRSDGMTLKMSAFTYIGMLYTQKKFPWNNIIVYDCSVYQKQTDIESDIVFLELASTICSFK